jgi:hypothetical protein
MKNYKKLPIPKDSAWEKNSLWYKFPTPVRNFCTGVSNLIKWFPTIWRQRDWDDSYIFEILKKKIEFQRECLVESNRHTRIDIDNRDMTIVLNLIERVTNDFYELEAFDYEDSEYILKEVGDGSSRRGLQINVKSERHNDYLSKYGSSLRQVYKKYPQGTKREYVMLVARYNQKKAKDLLFRMLNERIERWWD